MRATLKTTETPASLRCDTLVIPIFQQDKVAKLSPSGRAIDKANKGAIKALLNDEFKGGCGSTLLLPGANGTDAKRILLWGLGDKSKLDAQNTLKASAALATAAVKLKGKHLALIADIKTGRQLPTSHLLQTTVAQINRATYVYTETKESAKEKASELNRISVVNAEDTSINKTAIKRGLAIGNGIKLTRMLGDLPGNICTPKFLSSEARKLGRQSAKVSTKVLGEKAMAELGMGSLLSVGHGSDQESQLIIMEYKGGPKSQKPHVLVGKGITFDTGGISLKPGGKMDEMKFDMCGAASVFGTMQALVEMDLKLNVVAVVAAAENMPSGRATKPGDVVTSMSGKTIEVLNTDAEGRLVLCDALTYVERYKPQSVVDMATLTGACIVALGHHASGLMSNNDELAQKLLDAGTTSGDRAWQLPIWSDYTKQLQSNFADLANIGGPAAGTITAACFLSQFTENYPWAHIDIAGTAWNQGGGKGASGRPVSLLSQYLIDLSGK